MKPGIAAVLAVAVCVGVGTSPAPAGVAKIVPFAASYSGTAVVKKTDQVVDISANGTGTGTLIGKSTISGKGTGDASAPPCVPFTGPGVLVGTNGTKVFFTVIAGSQGCSDDAEGTSVSVAGKAKVTKATGKLLKARGTLKFFGSYDNVKGTFSIKFKGSLTK